jgi:hypothetical protein
MASSSMATLACLVVLEAMIGGAYVGILSSMLRRVAPILQSVKGSNKEITQVEVRGHGSDNLEPMKKSGESWTISKTLKGPLNIHLVAEGGGWRVLDDVIPEGWKARTDYPTKLQFGA